MVHRYSFSRPAICQHVRREQSSRTETTTRMSTTHNAKYRSCVSANCLLSTVNNCSTPCDCFEWKQKNVSHKLEPMAKEGQTEFSKPISASTWLESSDVCEENQSACRISKYKFLFHKKVMLLHNVQSEKDEDKLEDCRFNLIQLLPWCGD